VKVTSLSVEMSNGDGRSVGDVCLREEVNEQDVRKERSAPFASRPEGRELRNQT